MPGDRGARGIVGNGRSGGGFAFFCLSHYRYSGVLKIFEGRLFAGRLLSIEGEFYCVSGCSGERLERLEWLGGSGDGC